MISHGDERGRSQSGNNNAYCQDNALTWLDWRSTTSDAACSTFTKKLTALRRAHPVLRRSTFFKGRALRGSEVTDICWLRHDGAEMSDADWSNGRDPLIGRIFTLERAWTTSTRTAKRCATTNLLLLVNSHTESIDFSLPFDEDEALLQLLLDTSNDGARESAKGGQKTTLGPASLKLFLRSRRTYRGRGFAPRRALRACRGALRRLVGQSARGVGRALR